MTDASGTWVLWSNQVATLNGKQVSSFATDLRMCNGAVQVKSTDANWYVYTAATQIWAPTSATCPVTAPPTSSSTTGTSTTGSATLSWALGTDPGLAGYYVYVGTSSGVYNYPGSPFTTGLVSTYTIPNLPKGQTYFFALKAFNSSAQTSVFSVEVSKSIY